MIRPSRAMIRRIVPSIRVVAGHTAQWRRVRGGGMAEPRVKAGLWVQMALRMGDRDGRPGVVLRKGDADAGGVLVVLRGRDGLVVLSQMRDADGALAWMRATGTVAVDQAAVDAYIARQ